MQEITRADISLPKRSPDTHKGNYGRVLLICGSEKYTGAAFFAAEAAVRSGSGLVFVSVPKVIRPVLAAKLNEPILVPRRVSGNNFDATLIGCGLGLGFSSLSLLRRELSLDSSPLIIDADAITLAAKFRLSLKRAKRKIILTPHEGEFSRLCPDFCRSRRKEFAENFARENDCILVLKGHRTITATPDGGIYINTSGNPGMAKGGSGDILAGVITSLIGQGIPAKEAAYTGVWLHGASGDLAAKTFGEFSMTPSDMLGTLKSVICEVSKSE